jgi:hypothetical protein
MPNRIVVGKRLRRDGTCECGEKQQAWEHRNVLETEHVCGISGCEASDASNQLRIRSRWSHSQCAI